MYSSTILAMLVMIFVPNTQGKRCPRTNLYPGNSCAAECLPRHSSCSDKKECICDGDCGYSCVKKGLRCPRPKSINNGRRVVNGREFNDTVVFTCYRGFTLSGPRVRTCRGLGTWDGKEPKCGKNCDDPGIGNNNTLRREPITNAGFLTSQVLHYFCISGYHIAGKSSIRCKENGEWDITPPPKCYRTVCPPPTLPANSAVFKPSWFNISQGARHNRQLFLTCNPGYQKTALSSVMKCNQGQWEVPPSFKCIPKSCGDPGIPRNGARHGLIYHFNSRVTFSCDKCYKLKGASYRVCNADQTWSDKQPVCRKDDAQCKTIVNIPNGKVGLTSLDCGGLATFSCDQGYQLIGSQQISCRVGGNWSANIPRCEPITCKRLNSSGKVQVNVPSYQVHSTADFSCPNNYYVLNGVKSISCQENGEWSGSVPECLAPCYVQLSPNLISRENVYRHGTKAELSCLKGFILTGIINNKMPLCYNGTWELQSAKFPHCEDENEHNKIKEKFLSGITG